MDVIAKAQRAHFVSSKPTAHDDGRLETATCYYKLEPEYQSVSLEVISRSKTGVGSPPEFWRERFRGDTQEQDFDRDETASNKKSAEDEGVAEAEHRKRPEHVEDVGDDAYWVNTGRDGALYVLNGERIIRLSLGGRTPQEEKKVRAIEIANSALKSKSHSKSRP
jgi:hypothetical protein